MLSKIHRRAEALDEACLRAWGHPHDHRVQQELLNALEWDASLRADHARPVIRDRFKQVRDHSADLAGRIRASANNPDGAVHAITHGAGTLRRSLAALKHALENRHKEPRPD